MNKTLKIFGYGSLINQLSLLKTVPSAKNIFPCKLYGFVRVFNVFEDKAKTLICNNSPRASLNLEKSEWNEYINGICFDMSYEDFENLKVRENQYELVSVEITDYENTNNKYRAYTFRAKHFETYEFQFESEAQKEYLRICIEGCKNISEEFLEEFRKTTFVSDKTLHELGM